MSFPDEGLTRDAFLGGRIALWQPRTGYRAATDPVLLAAFAPVRPGEVVLELGCGAGTAALCLLARVPQAAVHGIELQPAYADLARRNAAENGLALSVHEGDLAAMPPALRVMRFDHVIANPPFHAAGTRPRDPGRAGANAEATPVSAWLEAGLRRLRPGGTLTLIHRTARLGAILAALEGRAGGTEVLPLLAREGRPAERILLRTRKTSRSPLLLHSPFTLHEGSAHPGNAGRYTRPAERVLRDMFPLLPGTRLGGICG
jgi:tRNA1Val (adenine37-N6)-methyltransferase